MRIWLPAAIAGAIAGGGLLGVMTRPSSPQPLPQLSPSVPSHVSKPSAAVPDFLGVVLSGTAVDLAPKAEGRVQSVLVKPGDRVVRGSVVAEIDVRALQKALALAESALADAEQRLERRSNLEAGVLSQEEVSNAKVLVLERRTRVEELRAALTDARLRAPFDGVVAARYLDAGAMAAPQRPVVRLLGSDQPRVRFAIPEAQAGRVVVGDQASVQVKTMERPLAAVVESVAPEVDSAARMIFAVARVTAPAGVTERLSAGLLASVHTGLQEGERAEAR
jgi:RND family efflux transporter MFP subunit